MTLLRMSFIPGFDILSAVEENKLHWDLREGR